MDIAIRTARADELAEIGELTGRAYLDDGLLAADEGSYLAKLRDAGSRAARAELLVAVDAATDEVLGSVTFAVSGGAYAEISRPGEGEFRALAVRSAARGRGAGEALVRACMGRARELGLRRLVLSSKPAMRAAHRLYERLGFVRLPERDWSPAPGVDLLAYGCECGAADGEGAGGHGAGATGPA